MYRLAEQPHIVWYSGHKPTTHIHAVKFIMPVEVIYSTP